MAEDDAEKAGSARRKRTGTRRYRLVEFKKNMAVGSPSVWRPLLETSAGTDGRERVEVRSEEEPFDDVGWRWNLFHRPDARPYRGHRHNTQTVLPSKEQMRHE